MRDWSPIPLVLGFSLIVGQASAQSVKVSPPSAAANPEIGGKTLDEWIKLIGDRDPSVRDHAIRMVGQLGPAAKRAVPALSNQLNIPNDLSPLCTAIIAIGQIAPDDPKDVQLAVGKLVSLLSHDQHIVRYQAATTLGHIGPPARSNPVIEKLAGMIKSNMSWELRRAAAYALGRLGRDDLNLPDMKALTALVDGIDDHCKEVRVESLQGLINLGIPTNPAHQATLRQLLVKRTLVDKDKFAAIWVRVALIRMDTALNTDSGKQVPPLIDYIARQLKSSEPGVPADAARALGACGPVAKHKIADLIEAMKSSDITQTVWCAWALGRMGSDAKNALPSLTVLLESADPNVKSAAQEAIKDITGAKP